MLEWSGESDDVAVTRSVQHLRYCLPASPSAGWSASRSANALFRIRSCAAGRMTMVWVRGFTGCWCAMASRAAGSDIPITRRAPW